MTWTTSKWSFVIKSRSWHINLYSSGVLLKYPSSVNGGINSQEVSTCHVNGSK